MSDAQVCHRHPEREAYIACQRCERPICPECMREAAVGFQCPSCVAQGQKAVRQPRTLAGGRVPVNAGSVSTVLIAVNVAVFVLTDLVRLDAVTAWGAMIASNVLADGQVYSGVADGGYWRLLTAAFLHAGVLHLLMNMYALYLFGPFIERALGTARFVVAYLTAAVGSSAVVYLLSDPRTFTVGASGAVFGLFGMALILLVKARQDVRTLLALLVVNGLVGVLFSSRISWEGHLGGFVVGCLIGAAVAYAPRERRTLVQTLTIGAIWLATAGIVVLRTAQLT